MRQLQIFSTLLMEPLFTSLIVFLITFSGAILGLFLAHKIPKKYLEEDSRHSINLTLGLVSTITALILGLVTASAKDSFDNMDRSVRSSEIQLLTLDRILDHYGPETNQMRQNLKSALERIIQTHDSRGRSEELVIHSSIFEALDKLVDDVRNLQPKDAYHQTLYGQAIGVGDRLLESRWFALNSIDASVPKLFLSILVIWLFVIFAGFGLTSPTNRLVIFMFLLGSFSMSSGIFLILELDGAFDGLIYISSKPLVMTYKLIGMHY